MYNQAFSAKLYNLGKKILTSEFKPVDHLARFLESEPDGRVILEMGSGNRRLRPDIINVDLFPFPNVDILADIQHAPLRTNSIDSLILDAVLEHVPEPQLLVNEVRRVLKPGGRALCVAPLIHPYHAYPDHYFNFTASGLRYLFRAFARCDVCMHRGPTVAVINILSDYVALAFSRRSEFAYRAWKAAALLPIFLFKYLDLFWRGPNGMRIAHCLCAMVVK